MIMWLYIYWENWPRFALILNDTKLELKLDDLQGWKNMYWLTCSDDKIKMHGRFLIEYSQLFLLNIKR